MRASRTLSRLCGEWGAGGDPMCAVLVAAGTPGGDRASGSDPCWGKRGAALSHGSIAGTGHTVRHITATAPETASCDEGISLHDLFGSATQDGFEVLETLDANQDGVIDAADAVFAGLRIWQDADEDGISDPGELRTLAEHRIISLALARTGALEGHGRGFAATFTRANGSTGTAETICFQTDRADTLHPTPAFIALAAIGGYRRRVPRQEGMAAVTAICTS